MHRAPLKRHFSRQRRGSLPLAEREPALLNLPIPLPSVPLLNPIVTPIIAGPAAQATHSPTPGAPAQSTPPSSGGGSTTAGGSSSGSGGNTGSSGGSSGGSSSGNSEGDGNTGSGNTGSSSSSTGGGGSSGGSGSGPGGGSVSIGSSPSSGGVPSSSLSPSSSSLLSSDSPASTGTLSPSSATDSSIPSTPSGGPVLSGTPGSSTSGNTQNGSTFNVETDPGTSENVTDSNNTPSSSVGNGSPIPPAGTSSAISPPPTTIGGTPESVGTNGEQGGNSDGDSPTPSAVGDASTKHGLSGGAIGGIVAAVVLLLGVLFIINLRRRARNRRAERQIRWMAGTNGDHSGGVTDAQRLRQSQRSSFGTPFRRSVAEGRLSSALDQPSPFTLVPDLPPMAQIDARRPIPPPLVTITSRDERGVSLISLGSTRSSSSFGDDGNGQVLAVPEAAHGSDMPSTPMSVRPFSPTERFSFPKPPTSAATTDRTSLIPSTISSKPGTNPFADPDTQSPSAFTFGHGPSLEDARFARLSVSFAATPIIAINPFSDPVESERDRPSTSESTATVVAGTRAMVQRPFVPTLSDELKVVPGEGVLVLQAFDDGWAQVRKDNKETGLIPIDCFREKGEDVPAFLASGRVSSFFEKGIVVE